MAEPTDRLQVLEVPEAAAGQRLDVWLAAALDGPSRAQIRRLIEAGALLLDGQPERKLSRKLAGGERLQLELAPAPEAPRLLPNPGLSVALLHVDADVLVIDKPAGLVVHPAAGHADDTLVNALAAMFPDLPAAFPDSMRPGLVHRLDRDTSGVMVVARHPAAAASLKAQFKARSVDKVYGTLVRGALSPIEGLIEAPIGRDPQRRKRMALRLDGKAARTGYRVLAQAEGYSWVEARLLTGRTHQIRVHMAGLGHPVIGDMVYGKRDRRIGRLALHAWQLAFDQPSSGERVAFVAPLPEDLRRALAELGIDPEIGRTV